MPYKLHPGLLLETVLDSPSRCVVGSLRGGDKKGRNMKKLLEEHHGETATRPANSPPP
jgi:hypothetical protein